MANRVMKYIREDNSHKYGLEEEVRVVLTGDNVTLVEDGDAILPVQSVDTEDGSLSISPTDSNFDLAVCLVAHPFPADSGLWNGPDLISDSKYRAMLASLFHDLIWEHSSEIAKAWGVSKKAVLSWGDGVLYALWVYASDDSILGRIEARIAWSVCEFSRGWYHSAKKLLGLHSITIALMLLAGCGTPPNWTVAEIAGTNAVVRAMGQAPAATPSETIHDQDTGGMVSDDAQTVSPASDEGSSPSSPSSPENPPTSSTTDNPDAVDFGALSWSYGGFSGGKAKLVSGVVIGGLKVSGSGLSYSWKQGGCEKLGASSADDASCLACLFVHSGGKWQGGKFDWISTSRRTRDFKNIVGGGDNPGGYNGWPKNAIGAADEFAFVIVSKDGAKRSNVAHCKK